MMNAGMAARDMVRFNVMEIASVSYRVAEHENLNYNSETLRCPFQNIYFYTGFSDRHFLSVHQKAVYAAIHEINFFIMHNPACRNIIILLMCFFLHSNLAAQTDKPALRISEEDGLSDNNIECIFKDHNDYFWVGTSSGLNLIDGSAITVFKNIPGDKSSINNNQINCIGESSNGTLWIGTQAGLNSYDPESRSFRTIPLIRKNNLQSEAVTDIAVDATDHLFIATSFGLLRYDPVTNKGVRIEIPGSRSTVEQNNKIASLAFGPDGLLYLCTYNGLWSYDEKSKQFNHLINKAELFTTLAFDHMGNLWIGTWDEGLIQWNVREKKSESYDLPDKNSAILTIAETPGSGGDIIMTNAFYLTPGTANKEAVVHPFPFVETVKALFYNPADQRIWEGTSHGLFLIRKIADNFSYHRFNRAITSQDVSILEWNHQFLIGGEGNDFLKLYDRNFNELKNFSGLVASGGAECLTIQPDGANTLKCGTTDGIVDINPDSKEVVFRKLKDISANQRQLNFITCLFKDNYGSWWIFPWRNGIWEETKATHVPQKVFNNFVTSFNLPKPLVVSGACEDHKGNIWMSDYDEGIILYNRNTHTFSKPFADSLGPFYSCGQIFYYHGNCYSFVSTTLLIWNTDSMVLHRIPLLPLRDKAITAIAADSSGHVWMATQNGLIAYDIKEKTLLHFTSADGLISNQLGGTLYCAQDGMMIFACPQYLFSFSTTGLLKHTQKAPQIKLSEVTVDESPFRFLADNENIFDHTKRNFIFKWTVTDYTDPLNNHYYYRLEGIDKNWRNAGTKGEAEFANLSPGHYTLLLKGENSNGVSAVRILKMQFVILPPFWNTWWFITLLFLLVAAFFYSLYRYRLNQLMRVEKLRDNISLNLHDDIGSTLSSISILSEMALHRNTDDESEKMLEEIKENSLIMMERMDDIVWSINPKNDSLENLFARIRIFAGKLFEAKEIEYNISIGESIRHVQLNMEYRQHIYLIMKEAINNLIKHSDCTLAKINASYTAPWLELMISDNGKGIQKSESTGGNGLYSMKKRAAEIRGILDIQSHKGKGTTISLKVKIK